MAKNNNPISIGNEGHKIFKNKKIEKELSTLKWMRNELLKEVLRMASIIESQEKKVEKMVNDDLNKMVKNGQKKRAKAIKTL